MPNLRRPGTYAEELLLSPQNVLGTAAVSITGAFVGTNGRGPVNPTFISTWNEYTSYFGGYSGSYLLPYAVFQYFANGGQGVYVTRVAGVGSAIATRNLVDRGSSQLGTLQVTALNPGAWGNSIFIDVADYGVAGTGRFTLTVHFGDASANTVVEKWTDLSMDPTDSRYVVNMINAGNGSGSRYIVVTNLNSANTLVQSEPAVITGQQLVGGADGSAAGSTEYQNAVLLLDQIHQPLVLNLPGVTDTTTLTTTINYAISKGSIFVVVDTAAGLTSATAITAVSALPTSSYAAAYWPWVQVNDPSVATPGVTKLVPPGGSVVGQYINTDATRGVWKAPAGMANRIAGAVGLELKLTNNDLDSLNSAVPAVNAIRNIPGAGVCIMGARTLDPTTANVYVNVRRTIIYLKAALVELMRPAVFEPNDWRLWKSLNNSLSTFLSSFWQQGGLSGLTPDKGFYVKCDGVINTAATIAQGQVIAEVGIATSNPAEFVILRIGQTNGGATVTENN
jgi:phage tail sheath protein FI